MAAGGRRPRPLWVAAAKGLSREARRRDAEGLPNDEGEVEDGEGYLMGGEDIGAEGGNSDRVDEKAKPEGELFGGRREADPEDAFEHRQVGRAVFSVEVELDELRCGFAGFSEGPAQNGPERHPAADGVADDSSDGGTRDLQTGKSELSVDEQVVKDDVH